jgi:hypothetical protein
MSHIKLQYFRIAMAGGLYRRLIVFAVALFFCLLMIIENGYLVDFQRPEILKSLRPDYNAALLALEHAYTPAGLPLLVMRDVCVKQRFELCPLCVEVQFFGDLTVETGDIIFPRKLHYRVYPSADKPLPSSFVEETTLLMYQQIHGNPSHCLFDGIFPLLPWLYGSALAVREHASSVWPLSSVLYTDVSSPLYRWCEQAHQLLGFISENATIHVAQQTQLQKDTNEQQKTDPPQQCFRRLVSGRSHTERDLVIMSTTNAFHMGGAISRRVEQELAPLISSVALTPGDGFNASEAAKDLKIAEPASAIRALVTLQAKHPLVMRRAWGESRSVRVLIVSRKGRRRALNNANAFGTRLCARMRSKSAVFEEIFGQARSHCNPLRVFDDAKWSLLSTHEQVSSTSIRECVVHVATSYVPSITYYLTLAHPPSHMTIINNHHPSPSIRRLCKCSCWSFTSPT